MNRKNGLLDLENKVAIVTGAASGIGRAIALKLAEYGANIAVADINFSEAKKVVHKIQSLKRKAIAINVDVARIEDVNCMVELAHRNLGDIDILINNAGMLGDFHAPLYRLGEDEWQTVMNVNLKSVFFCLKAVVNDMIKRKHGKIVNVSSIAGKTGGTPGISGAHYAASKAAVISLTKRAATELAKYGINVNAVAPALIISPMTEMILKETDIAPIGRLGTPEDVANLVLFLVSNAASFMTGQTIHINGGAFMSD